MGAGNSTGNTGNVGTSWVKLNIKCPHCGKGSQSYWRHHNCGEYLYINANARIECKDDHGAPFMSFVLLYYIDAFINKLK